MHVRSGDREGSGPEHTGADLPHNLALLLETFPTPAALLDGRGAVVACNPACRAHLCADGHYRPGPLWPGLTGSEEWGPLSDVLASGRAVEVDQPIGDNAAGPSPARWRLVPFDFGVEGARVLAVASDDSTASMNAREHAALLRIAMAIAEESNPVSVFFLVAEEAARLLEADVGSVARFESPTELVNLAAWTEGELPGMPPYGVRHPIARGSATEQVARTGHSARVSSYSRGSSLISAILHDAGARSGVSAPVYAGGRLWGCVSVASTSPEPLATEAEALLCELAQLVAVALEAADRRESLLMAATTDALTGLPNHRAFQEHLRRFVAHARRTGSPLAMVLFDIDSFKHINDTYGHPAGDEVLSDVAARLRSTVRRAELVARLGGDEFAVLMPGADLAQAEELACRAIARIRSVSVGGASKVTCSAGVCDLEHAADADEMYRFADGALYWAKEHGRDQVRTYLPNVVTELSARERAERIALERQRSALLALARAIDARDPSTRRHSARVAEISALLADAMGWEASSIARLRQAGLLHDVGKIGIPDAVLFKPGRLLPAEYDVVKDHSELGAQITGDVLDAEQVAWIRHHHEHWDGMGYPGGRRGDDIPEGAQLLAVADAWDVMRSGRAYRAAKTAQAAMAELQRCSGSQFSPHVVAVFSRLGPDALNLHMLKDMDARADWPGT